jgi:CDP-glucose 4,6-dehydratase
MTTSFWQDRPVFVTGCTGFLGSWLTAVLVESGADVVGLIRDQVPQSELVRSNTINRIRVVQGDVSDYALLERALAEYEIATVFHLAAQTIAPIANRAPLSTFETNIKGTWSLLEAARRNPTVQEVVVASSDKAYGDQPELPYREDAPLQGRHPYDVSKSCADLITLSYAHSFGLKTAVTRCANLYGGGDLNWSRIVPGTIRSLLRGEQPIVRSDGTFKRDYMFVLDAVYAYMLTAESLDNPQVVGQAFNFGLDNPIEALDLIKTIIRLSDHPDLEPIIRNEATNEIRDQYLASDKAARILGWQSRYTPEQGLREAMAWYKRFFAAS